MKTVHPVAAGTGHLPQTGTAMSKIARVQSATLSQLERFCQAKRLKMTDQRRIISRVLSEAEDHPDVEEVHRRAVALDDRISLATVYRTVKLFEDVGVV